MRKNQPNTMKLSERQKSVPFLLRPMHGRNESERFKARLQKSACPKSFVKITESRGVQPFAIAGRTTFIYMKYGHIYEIRLIKE